MITASSLLAGTGLLEELPDLLLPECSAPMTMPVRARDGAGERS